ncbi:CapA family protein [Streptomyces sp. MBT97]|nr:CapA family protein [Streptomyces sp. MBT97]MBK3635690.1 CapA family protein [Streptomyces sp. MBT97]
MIARRHQVAWALTALLASAAACQAHDDGPAGNHGRPAPPAARGFSLVATGEIRPYAGVVERARFDAGGAGYDFRPMLAGAEPLVSGADLALCHLDTVYGANGDYTGYPDLKSPPEIAAALAATGYDGCATASDHSLDDGPAGVQRTLDVLDGAGLRHAGTARTAAAGRPDIDLILGTGSHVPQAYEKVDGTWVVYGLGDQIAGETPDGQGVRDPRVNQSTAARFTFARPSRPGGRWEVREARFVPQMFDIDAGRVVDLDQALARGAGVAGARDRIRQVVLGRGAAKSGLTSAP